ncbi:MAG: dUTP diphosphatase [Chitinophagales bacterium]|nr:dUTP diphosphatase [Chitinophagales bacterium]MDW8393169.1 dUTP diphosphatase [Chitinophagales bacterium]
MKIKIINRSANPLPAYATEGSAGMDLYADLSEPVVLRPLERRLIPTGIFIELPAGYEAQVRPRSGLAIRQGLTLLNTPGTIDSDYRGEVQVIVINLSDAEQRIEPAQRIAQLVISRYEQVEWQVAEQLEQTSRGTGGFGHTGTS